MSKAAYRYRATNSRNGKIDSGVIYSGERIASFIINSDEQFKKLLDLWNKNSRYGWHYELEDLIVPSDAKPGDKVQIVNGQLIKIEEPEFFVQVVQGILVQFKRTGNKLEIVSQEPY